METKIRDLIKQSMRNKDKSAQLAYKGVLETAQKQAKNDKVDVNDSYLISATKKEIKALQDLLGFCKEDDTERKADINYKLGLLEALLPKMASSDDVLNFLVSNDIAKSMKDCMSALKAEFKDTLDGKVASQVAKNYCNS